MKDDLNKAVFDGVTFERMPDGNVKVRPMVDAQKMAQAVARDFNRPVFTPEERIAEAGGGFQLLWNHVAQCAVLMHSPGVNVPAYIAASVDESGYLSTFATVPAIHAERLVKLWRAGKYGLVTDEVAR